MLLPTFRLAYSSVNIAKSCQMLLGKTFCCSSSFVHKWVGTHQLRPWLLVFFFDKVEQTKTSHPKHRGHPDYLARACSLEFAMHAVIRMCNI
jgi:hypothetical protein